MFDASSWAARLAKDAPPRDWPSETPEEFRRRKRQDQRSAAMKHQAAILKPLILDMIAPEMGEIAAVVVQAILARERNANG